MLCQPGLTALREVCVCIPDIFVGNEYRQENKIAQPSQLTQFKQMTRNSKLIHRVPAGQTAEAQGNLIYGKACFTFVSCPTLS